MQQPDIGAWMDRVRVQLDPSPPQQRSEPEWALIAGIAAGIVLLLSGSIYWLFGSNSKDESELVVVRGTSMNAGDPALATRTSTATTEKATRGAVPVRQARVPRVTEEAPNLPVENASSPALRAVAKAETRATAAVRTEQAADRTNSTGTRIAATNSAPARAEAPKTEEPKAPRREPPTVSAQPQAAKPPATKLALAEPVAAPIQSAAVTPTPSVPEAVIEMPRLKFMRAPDYPISAMRAGHTGTTTLELLVLESGVVGEATILSSSGYPKLDAAAVAVAKRSWKFFPGTKDGEPMPMKIEAPVRFSLD